MQPQLPNQFLPWPIKWAGVVLLCQSEGCRLQAYRCPAGVWTCGWGETSGVRQGDVWTQEQADSRLLASLIHYTYEVRDMCTLAPTDNQLSALVVFAYNVGLEALRNSSVLRAHNRGDTAAASRTFGLYNKARVKGKLTVEPGLVTRRAHEAALYLTPGEHERAHPVPQAVADAPSAFTSPVAQSGAAATAAGTVTVLGSIDGAQNITDTASTLVSQASVASEVAGTARGVLGSFAETLGVTPGALLGLALVAAGVAACVWLYRKRAEGHL